MTEYFDFNALVVEPIRYPVSKIGYDKPNNNHWYESPDGKRIPITEDTLHYIWFQWVSTPGVYRADTDTEVVFVFATPITCDFP